MSVDINFKLSNIQIISKGLTSVPPTGMPNIKFQFEITVEQKVQAKTKSVLVFVFVNIHNEDGSELWGYLNSVCFFSIQNFDEVLIQDKDGRFLVPKDFQNVIAPIAISTTRGIIYSEFRGTHLHNAIMPVIMPQDMNPIELKDDHKKIIEG